MRPGVPGVRVEAEVGDDIYLATHTSTSEDRAVAEGFAKDGGMVIEFGAGGWRRVALTAADVSWISKFPSESEQLQIGGERFTVKSIKEVDGLQHVVLTE